MLINIMFTLWMPTDWRTLSFLFLWKVSRSQSCAVSKDVLMAERPELWTEINDTAPSWPRIQLTICFVSARKVKAEEQNSSTKRARQEKSPAGEKCHCKNRGVRRWVYPTFVKALYSVISQGYKELGGSAEIEGQSSAGLSCFLRQAKSAHRQIKWLRRRSGLAKKPRLLCPQSHLFLPMSNT